VGDAIDWLQIISRLRIDRASGDPAPHKPLLLLVVCDLAENNQFSDSTFALTPELASRFFSYWSIVAKRRRQGPDIRLPFHHLGSDGIWSPLDGEGQPSPSFAQTRFAAVSSDFSRFINDPGLRNRARHLLIAKFFPPSEQVALYEATGLPIPGPVEIEQNSSYRSAEEARLIGREARFRVSVLAAYDYTCALTGHRLTTITGGSIVDAAHVHQFAISRNNDVENGLALSKTAHWLFDQGLWSVSDDYEVVVAVDAFSESAPDSALLLGQRHGSRLILPRNRSLWPSPAHLAWHRNNKLKQC
jgi:putative restriction endonuclease